MVTVARRPTTRQTINVEAINKAVVLTPRVQRLKEIRFTVGTPTVSAERARLYMESWRKTKGEHPALRRAKAFRHFLENKEIVISADELLVGTVTKYPHGAYPNPQEFPNYVGNVFRQATQAGSISVSGHIPKEDIDTILECCDFWAAEDPMTRIMQKVREITGDLYFKMMNARLLTFPPSQPYLDLAGQDWDNILSKGLAGMIEDVRGKIAGLKQNPLTTEATEKLNWYEAVIISLEAVITLARRYGQLAREMAATETNRTRRAELERIAQACEWAPANPPRSFHEAVQSHWFIILGLELEKNNRFELSLGRVDQFLWPYYERDMREGRITCDEAGELLGCLLVKVMGVNYFAADFALNLSKNLGGGNEYSSGADGLTYTVGGVDRRGQDASNELSVLMLEAVRQVKPHMPYVHLRYHRAMAPELVDKAIQCNADGAGNPAWFNDRHGTEILLERGFPIEEARDWCLVGCVFVTHKASSGSGINTAWINHAKLIELALNNGVDPVTGERFGPATGDPVTFRTFNDVLEAYNKQYDHLLDMVVQVHNATWAVSHEDALYHPLTSACVAGQIDLGMDASRGGRYPAHQATGIADRCLNDAADCLTAIKKLVFEEKRISMDRLVVALRANFEGHEDVRQLCLAAPKYGNDEDEPDAMMSMIWKNATDRILQYRGADGQKFRVLRTGGAWAHWAGKTVGALPNGRRAFVPLYDASASPMQGGGAAGFTAVLNSVSKCCDPVYVEGPVLNQRLAPRVLRTREGRAKFAAMVASFLDRPSHHIQFNTFDRETLLDARKHPENYRNLLVRVAGYNAFWVELTPEVQDEILGRMEQGLE